MYNFSKNIRIVRMKAKYHFIVLIFSIFILNIGNMWGQTSDIIENEDDESVTVRASILNGPTAIPSVYMMEKTAEGKQIYSHQTINLTFEKFADPQALLPKLIKNEIDVGFLPVNIAAKVYNSSNKSIVCAGITGNTNLVLITKDKNISSMDDLSDKTVYVAGQGATPEYLFRWLLTQNNVSNVTLDYSIPPANLPGQVIAGKIQYAVVPEPFASIAISKSKDVFYAIDLQEEYERIAGTGKTVPFTVVVARREFAKENPEALKEYLELLENSMKWAISNPGAAGEYCKKNDIGLAPTVVTNAIPKSNYVFIPAVEAQNKIEELLNIFISLDKKSVGDSLPDSDFYFKSASKVSQTEN